MVACKFFTRGSKNKVHFDYVLLMVFSCMCFINESTSLGIYCATLILLNMREIGIQILTGDFFFGGRLILK